MLVVILNMTRGHTVTDHAMLLYLDQKDLDVVAQSHMFIINFMASKFFFKLFWPTRIHFKNDK